MANTPGLFGKVRRSFSKARLVGEAVRIAVDPLTPAVLPPSTAQQPLPDQSISRSATDDDDRSKPDNEPAKQHGQNQKSINRDQRKKAMEAALADRAQNTTQEPPKRDPSSRQRSRER
jgi:hypothetical protein